MYAILKSLAQEMTQSSADDLPLFDILKDQDAAKLVGLATIGSWIIEALETAPALREARRPQLGYEWREDGWGWDENRPLKDKAPFSVEICTLYKMGVILRIM